MTGCCSRTSWWKGPVRSVQMKWGTEYPSIQDRLQKALTLEGLTKRKRYREPPRLRAALAASPGCGARSGKISRAVPESEYPYIDSWATKHIHPLIHDRGGAGKIERKGECPRRDAYPAALPHNRPPLLDDGQLHRVHAPATEHAAAEAVLLHASPPAIGLGTVRRAIVVPLSVSAGTSTRTSGVTGSNCNRSSRTSLHLYFYFYLYLYSYFYTWDDPLLPSTSPAHPLIPPTTPHPPSPLRPASVPAPSHDPAPLATPPAPTPPQNRIPAGAAQLGDPDLLAQFVVPRRRQRGYAVHTDDGCGGYFDP